jgi:hypothetical protein
VLNEYVTVAALKELTVRTCLESPLSSRARQSGKNRSQGGRKKQACQEVRRLEMAQGWFGSGYMNMFISKAKAH